MRWLLCAGALMACGSSKSDPAGVGAVTTTGGTTSSSDAPAPRDSGTPSTDTGSTARADTADSVDSATGGPTSQALVLSDGDVLRGTVLTAGDLVVPAGATVTTEGVVIVDVDRLLVYGTLSADGQGHPGGNGYTPGGGLGGGVGYGYLSPGSGGGFGGAGGVAIDGYPYGDGTVPGGAAVHWLLDDLGSGGGGGDDGDGGAGGGALYVVADQIHVGGTISARGASGLPELGATGGPDGGGGGAGGLVHLTADVLSGTGVIDVSGGDMSPAAFDAGGGGGGWVVVASDAPFAWSVVLDGGLGRWVYPDDGSAEPGRLSIDADGDGLGADEEAERGLDPNDPDTDGDGWADGHEALVTGTSPSDPDTDDDGVLDGADPCPFGDADADMVCDADDNCPFAANADQADGDGDGRGDACDPCVGADPDDTDGDGWCNDLDRCPDTADPDQLDSDGDGVGDACDPCVGEGGDADGDGLCDDLDLCPDDPTPTVDTDGDGRGDVCDDCPLLYDEPTRFFETQELLSHDRLRHVDAADLDGDGDLDVVLADRATVDPVIWYVEQGDDGVFAEPVEVHVGSSQFALGDVDRDGVDEVVVSTNTEMVWLDLDAGVWSAPQSLFPQTFTEPVEAVDIDGDGHDDLVVESGIDQVLWRRNTGAAQFGDEEDVGESEKWFWADLDGDGTQELVGREQSMIRVETLDNGVFVRQQEVDVWGWQDFDVADLDGDGDADLVGVGFHPFWGWDRLEVIVNDGGTLLTPVPISSAHLFGEAVDIDGDGLVDGLTHAMWFRNLGTTFEPAPAYGDAFAHHWVGDLTGDGLPDLIADGTDRVVLLRNAPLAQDTDGDGLCEPR